MKQLAQYALVGTVALGLAACGGSAKEDIEDDYVFVNDISGMEPDPVYPNSWVKPGYKDIDKYQTYLVEDVEVVYTSDDMRELDQEQVSRVQAYFRDAVKSKLSEAGYTVVESAQDDTMAIKLSITGLEVPSGAAANTATTLMIGVSTQVGSVTVEGAFIDASTGEVQIVAADSRRGSYANSSPWSTWEDIQDAMDDWADEIVQSFDDIHEAAGKKMEG